VPGLEDELHGTEAGAETDTLITRALTEMTTDSCLVIQDPGRRDPVT